jgi:carbamoyltransferase
MTNITNNYILGISYGYHDSAVALLQNGIVLSAVEEERFSGIKHDSRFPANSINWILKKHGITRDDIHAVCYYENPTIKTHRNKKSYWKYFWKNPLNFPYIDSSDDELQEHFPKSMVIMGNHHLSHLAYSYFTSDFKESAILSVDGVGEWDTTVSAYGKDNQILRTNEVIYPHSLGLLYSTITAFLGFKPNEGEYKVMGLAPYGTHLFYHKKFDELIKETINGFELNLKYFSFHHSEIIMFNKNLSKLFGIPNRLPNEPLNDKHKNIAAALQYVYEKHFFRLLNKLHTKTKSDNLCLSGGCAYNGTANGKIKDNTPFKNIWIPPAPSDAGSAIGAALNYWNHITNDRKENKTPFLGPEETINETLFSIQKNHKHIKYDVMMEGMLIKKVAKLISKGKIIGWVDGKLEFGARALGNRSILANPRDPQMKRRVNMVVKKREGFRPFAPMVTYNDRNKYFNLTDEIPYMNQIVEVKDKYQDKLPAITHIDGTARVQTVRKNFNPKIYKLLKQVEIENKYPIILNTSFNLKDQTMVRNSDEAIETFLKCDMDYLVIGNYFISKK